MDINKFLVLFYKAQHYVFGICPHCKRIFQLSNCVISIGGKEIILPELSSIIHEQHGLDKYQEKAQQEQDKYYEKEEVLREKIEEYKNIEPIIKRKVRIEGRRQARNRIRKIDKVFLRRNINPKDAKLIFSPVEYVAFRGMTDNDDIEKITFIAKTPKSAREEAIQNSIGHSIKNGNLEFCLIRISDDGRVSYEKD